MLTRPLRALLSCAVLLITASPLRAQAVLLKATFFSHTNDDDKDHDTGIYIKVKAEDGTVIAHADNRDNSGDDGTQYKDNSDHQFDLEIDAVGIEKKDVGKFTVEVCIHTNGNDTWKMRSRVQLMFSDKKPLTASGGDVKLVNEGACTSYSM